MNGAPDILQRAPMVAVEFAKACAASRAHMAGALAALAEHGGHGPLVSGCVRSHFPESVKDSLRSLASDVAVHSYLARAARPKGMHAATVQRIGRAIATRDGSGYYGPQPDAPGALLQAGLALALPRAAAGRESGHD